MTTDDRQTCADDGDTHDIVDKTPAANVSAVYANANTAAFEEMFTAFKKKSEEQEKLIGFLAKQVETLTARTKVVLPRGVTKLCGRRLDFETPLGRIANTRDKSSGQATNETAPAAAQKDPSDHSNPSEKETYGKTSKATTIARSIQNRERHPEIPGPGTSIRTIPYANSIRQRGTRPRTAKFSALG
ncbi:hypothetical protein DY000_02033958 [Brassica cretica]|uniref:Uncharacterized protein n=1 Tax=Brassica cretica TaxID=69181 RepID=A0ABQ7DEQ5_BRACR|nr:hypothetical protein DY000_02033958 [Brassica cretica]